MLSVEPSLLYFLRDAQDPVTVCGISLPLSFNRKHGRVN